MSIQVELENRAGHKCELCESSGLLSMIALGDEKDVSRSVCICDKCDLSISENDLSDHNHWRCLNNSMWSEHSVVKVLSYRLLCGLRSEAWASDLLEQIYLDEEELAWAKEGVEELISSVVIKDSNGAVLSSGDSVTLIKDLVVKGANFTAKRGTMVKNITLTDDPKFIEGRVNGQHIVILTKYVKKTS